jgi:ribosomal protein RSM22 (predicted rRNA methylase)
MSARLPDHLFKAVEARLDKVRISTLRSGYADLSRRYRDQTVSEAERQDLEGGASDPHGRAPGGYSRGVARSLGYLAGRLPATYAAAQFALGQVPDAAFEGVTGALDLGAGPGTATWALSGRWPGLSQALLLESDPEMLRQAQALATAYPDLKVSLKSGDLAAQLKACPSQDLVLMAYVLSELDEAGQEALLAEAWAKAGRGLFLLEPGTPETSRRVALARTQLVALGGHVLAPCPQDGACPAVGQKWWCHFSVRLERRGLHKLVKGGDLGYEDERFSWLFVSKLALPAAPYRLHADPHRRNRNLTLDVCDREGKRRELFYDRRKTDANLRQAARRLSWGSAWDPAAVPPAEPDPEDLDDQDPT